MAFLAGCTRSLRLSILLATLAASALTRAQNAQSTYDPRLTFAPLTLPDPVNAYRSSNGSPGPSYWQNEADYQLHATLDAADKLLSGAEIITYTNNSPDTLPSLWIQLEQNVYRKDSRGQVLFGSYLRRRRGNATPGRIFRDHHRRFCFRLGRD
jgi:hypothetical protein